MNNNKIYQLSILIDAALAASAMNATAIEIDLMSAQEDTTTGTPIIASVSQINQLLS